MDKTSRIARELLREAVAFHDLFFHAKSRATRVWAYQLPDGSYRPGDHPLTMGDVLSHFSGDKTLAAYLLDARDKVKFIGLDIDLVRSVIRPLQAQGFHPLDIYDKFKSVLLEVTRELFDHLCPYFPRPYAAFSGGKGHHIYAFFQRSVPAKLPLCIALQALEQVEYPKELISITAYPRQLSRRDGYGDIIKLPYGAHQVTGERTRFIDRLKGEPLDLLPSEVVRHPIDPDLPSGEPPDERRGQDLQFEMADELPEQFLRLITEYPRIREVFEGRGKQSGDLTRSGIDMSLLGVAINAGITDPGDLAAIIAYRPNAKACDHPSPSAYIRRTVTKALQYFLNPPEQNERQAGPNARGSGFSSACPGCYGR